jgi:hypothetical protein
MALAVITVTSLVLLEGTATGPASTKLKSALAGRDGPPGGQAFHTPAAGRFTGNGVPSPPWTGSMSGHGSWFSERRRRKAISVNNPWTNYQALVKIY